MTASCTVEEKRRFLKSIIRKIVWDGENVTVYLFAHDGEAVLPEFEPSEENEVPLSADSK